MTVSIDPEKLRKQKHQQIRLSAMNLLARREHSVKELTDKLRLRYLDSDCDYNRDGNLIETVVDDLKSQDLQSDQRFVESFIRLRASQGKGPVRICQELKQRGISAAIAKSAIHCSGVDWYELALTCYLKKFAPHRSDSVDISFSQLERKEQVKRQRYLSYRGFNFEHIAYALNPSK